MTIDEAKRILWGMAETGVITCLNEDKEAIKLGIEALKAIQRLHRDGHISKVWLLPGETKD